MEDEIYKSLVKTEKDDYLHLQPDQKQWLANYRTKRHLSKYIDTSSGGSPAIGNLNTPSVNPQYRY